MPAAYTIELRRLDAPGDNDAGLLAAIAQDCAETAAWYAASNEEQRYAIIRRWNRMHILSLRASIAACPPKTRAGLVAKAEAALEEWRRRDRTVDSYARHDAALATALESALAMLADGRPA